MNDEQVLVLRKNRRIRNAVVTALICLSIALACSTFFAFLQRNSARRETSIAVARKLAAESYNTDGQTRLLLALESLKRLLEVNAGTLTGYKSLEDALIDKAYSYNIGKIESKALIDASNTYIAILNDVGHLVVSKPDEFGQTLLQIILLYPIIRDLSLFTTLVRYHRE